MISISVLSQFQGCLLGGAIGDALGYPIEFLTLDEIKIRFGENGVSSFDTFDTESKGLISDDTQWTLAYAHALLDIKGGLGGNLVEALRRRSIEWYQSPENDRTPGNACLEGCRKLLRGSPWLTAGSTRAKGSGSVMRVAPFGLVYANQPILLDEVAMVSSMGTHRHPLAISAAVVTARIVAFALQCKDLGHFKKDVLESVLKDLQPDCKEVVEKLKKAKQLSAVCPEEVFPVLGEGWVAEEAIAGALYCVLSTSSFSEAVLRAVNTDGDSDTFGAITGNIAGALYGLENIPEEWVRVVEKSGELLRVAHALYLLSTEVDAMKTASPWQAFPEIVRALQKPESSLAVFDMLEAKVLENKEKFYKKDIWLDPHQRTDSVYITRKTMEDLIRSGKAKREEFSPLDSYIEIMQLQRRLLKDSRLPFSARMAMGIFASTSTDPWVQERYSAALALWMAQHNITTSIDQSVISDAALEDWKERLYQAYFRLRDGIATLEWAQTEIKKRNPDWITELKNLKGLKWESIPPDRRDDYEKFIFGLREILAPYLAKFGWVPLLEEWYLIAHAKFFRAGHLGSE